MQVKQLISKMTKHPETSTEQSLAPGITNLKNTVPPLCFLYLLQYFFFCSMMKYNSFYIFQSNIQHELHPFLKAK